MSTDYFNDSFFYEKNCLHTEVSKMSVIVVIKLRSLDKRSPSNKKKLLYYKTPYLSSHLLYHFNCKRLLTQLFLC